MPRRLWAVVLLVGSLPAIPAIGQGRDDAAGPGPREVARLVPDRLDFSGRAVADVAIQGDTAVLGMAYALTDGLFNGTVYTYERRAGEWVLESTIVPDDLDSSVLFGRSLAMNGEMLAVGDSWAGSGGAAYLFRRQGGRWIQQVRKEPSTNPYFATFGLSVDLDGDTWIVGAPGVGIIWGSVYVYRRIGRNWIEEARLTSDRVGLMDNFGWSVALKGDVLMIGANQLAINLGFVGPGYVIVFERTEDGWQERQTLTAPEGRIDDEFGGAIDLDGNRAVIGAPRHSGHLPRLGAAYVYRRSSAEWILEAKLTPPEEQDLSGFGNSVALEGDLIAVGAESWNEGDEDTGAVFLYRRRGEKWMLQDTVLPRDSHGEDHFGIAVDVHGGRLVAGAFGKYHPDASVLGYGSIFDRLRGPGADPSGDGCVDVRDLLKLLSAWGMCGDCREDLDGDGEVAVRDLLLLIRRMGDDS